MFDSEVSWESQSSVHLKAGCHSEEKAVVSSEWLIGCPLSSSDSLWWKKKGYLWEQFRQLQSMIKQNEQFKVSNYFDINT